MAELLIWVALFAVDCLLFLLLARLGLSLPGLWRAILKKIAGE